jgi:hypothetical protein
MDNDIEFTNQATVIETPVVFGPTYLSKVTTNYLLTLFPSSQAVGSGTNIPNISKGTDIGALQYGQPLPVIGNRHGLPPLWVQGITDLEVIAPSSNTINDVKDPLSEIPLPSGNRGNTGPTSIIETWTGGACGRFFMIMASGGHQDYYGNECYSWDTLQDAPEWTRRRDATLNTPVTNGRFTDGRPCSSHNYTNQIEAEGRYINCGQGSVNPSGFAGPMWFEWDFDAEDYIDLGDSRAPGSLANATVVFDPNGRNVIHVTGNNTRPAVRFYDLDTLTEQSTVQSDINSSTISSVVDPVNNYLIVFASGIGVYVMDLANTGAGFSLITPSGGPGTGTRWFWHVDGLVTWYGGQILYKLTPSDSSWSSASYTTVPLTGLTLNPLPTGGKGLWSSIGMTDVAGKKILLVIPSWNTTTDIFAIPLPDAGV